MTLRSRTRPALWMGVCLAAAACLFRPASLNAQTPQPAAPAPAATADPGAPEAAKLGAAVSQFGERVMGNILAESHGRTVLISPTSLMASLDMLAQGARGGTAEAFATGLGFEGVGLTVPAGAPAYAALRQGLIGRPGVTVALASGVWASTAAELAPSFVATQKAHFSAEVAQADFSKPETLMAINGFVARATQDKIPAILDRLPANAELVLVNALYFKGEWRQSFDPAATRPAAFTRGDGKRSRVPTMRRRGQIAYAEGPGFQAIALPYRDERFELLVYLPKSGAAPAGWLQAVGAAGFQSRPGEIALPRLKLSFNQDLLGPIRAAGLDAALGPGADYGGLTPRPVLVGAIAHGAVLVVDEAGAEGAAATAVVGVRSAASPVAAFSFKADRPFEIAIRERLTGAVLFLGHVEEPGAGA